MTKKTSELLTELFNYGTKYGYKGKKDSNGFTNTFGICKNIARCFKDSEIDRMRAKSAIYIHQPKEVYSDFFFWKRGLKLPRQKFLENLIKIYKAKGD